MARTSPFTIWLTLALLGCTAPEDQRDRPSASDDIEPSGRTRSHTSGDSDAGDAYLAGDGEAGSDAEIDNQPQGDRPEGDAEVNAESCGFGYEQAFSGYRPRPIYPMPERFHPDVELDEPTRIAYLEPPPPGYFRASEVLLYTPPEDLVLPAYEDDMPPFERGFFWENATRCYELPSGATFLTESEAYELYGAIVKESTGISIDAEPLRRTVVGIRGAYPGVLIWNGNAPDQFNDTIALLWIDADGNEHVREFPMTADVGAHAFGDHASSFLRAARRYRYVNGWHRGYNALRNDDGCYQVRDDSNSNGHWDSDRNGWLAPDGPLDHERSGCGHNIHMASEDGPLGSAPVDYWSAGCQVIPGLASWIEFITHAWTHAGASVDYFLIDARDIAPSVWDPCSSEDGSHRCPFEIQQLPFEHTADTAQSLADSLDTYNCSSANESGPEVMYAITLLETTELDIEVECEDPADIDVHLLEADDANACRARGHMSLSEAVPPGRYFIVADTYVTRGLELSGRYTLRVNASAVD